MAKINRKCINGVWFALTPTGRIGKVPLTRCSNTMTEANFKAWILSALRSRTKVWKPANDVWQMNTRPNTSGVGRHRVEHQCVQCLQWLPRKTKQNKLGIEMDHIIPIGGLDDLAKTPIWIEQAFIEIPGYQKLCTICHAAKTKGERK